ncbi:hypothetical protein [Sunxiuqinia sp. sy24]|uniref:hypothetical protein n=1 Tax=Sunxiuqinia sp. sy24 TaxID=3461495 RepID=UPI004045739B
MTNAQIIDMMLEELKSVATPQRKARSASIFPTNMRVLQKVPKLEPGKKNS